MAAGAAQLADPRREDIRARTLSGLAWKSASQVLAQLLSLVSIVALARLLTPRQFGIAAMAEVVSAFVITYADAGLGRALVQRPQISDEERSTVFWASLGVGACMAGVCFGLAPVIAAFYRTPQVTLLLRVLSLSFLFTALGSTHRSLQLRALNFRVLEIRSMAAGVVGSLAMIALAAAGFGALAIILADVVAAGVSAALLLALGGWRPGVKISWRSLRELAPFGLRYAAGTTFLTLNTNVDNVLVGRVLGQAALGVYSLAYSVILVPLSRLAQPVHQLLAPGLARLQHDRAALAERWLRVTQLLLLVFLPLMLTVAVTAHDIVVVVLGRRWLATVALVRIFAPICVLLSLQGAADAALQATGAMRTYVRMAGASFALNLAAFVIGVHWGLVGMALAFGASTLMFMTFYLLLVARGLGTGGRVLAARLRAILSAGVVLVAVELAAYELLRDAHSGWLARVAVTATLGIAAFAAICLRRERETVLYLASLVTQRRAFVRAGRAGR